MKGRMILPIALIVVLIGLVPLSRSYPVQAQDKVDPGTPSQPSVGFLPGELLVRFYHGTPTARADQVLAEMNAQRVR